MVEKQAGKNIKLLRSDKGGEYNLGDFNKYCKQNGIMQQFIVPHKPQKNGVAERKNRTLIECACSMLKVKDLIIVFGLNPLLQLYILKIEALLHILRTKRHLSHFMVLNLNLVI